MTLTVLDFDRFCLSRAEAHEAMDRLYDKFEDGMAFLVIAAHDHRGFYDGDIFLEESFPIRMDMIPVIVEKILEETIIEYFMEDVSDN
ncbi:hypothetical protein UFOVP353_50 [uncultured Caudovirales phage]|uniref:Uncharacterized protein n=1 Tax=uncultured Caudovirales phage TaxID=2100421 RepID=A0A6J5M0Q0_9CAUD|nr:hypothetical protein UFOVP353_50 [uncultured Caudovirales phage]